MYDTCNKGYKISYFLNILGLVFCFFFFLFFVAIIFYRLSFSFFFFVMIFFHCFSAINTYQNPNFSPKLEN